MGTAVVFTGGPRSGPVGAACPVVVAALATLQVDLVIAADSGLDLAHSLGWKPDVIVGDMDSVTPALLAAAEVEGAVVERHPVAKEATDLELAIRAAVSTSAEHLVVVGSSSGRMDHLIGGALMVASPLYAGIRIEAWLGGALVVPVHDRRIVRGEVGAAVSLLAVHGPAVGVTTSGLRWPLRDERLEAGSSRGISNEFVHADAEVVVSGGTVVVIVPEPEVGERADPRIAQEEP
jgi:thiamine pyrophosphokinase